MNPEMSTPWSSLDKKKPQQKSLAKSSEIKITMKVNLTDQTQNKQDLSGDC